MEFLKRCGDALVLLVRSLFDPICLVLYAVFVAPLIYVGAARGEPAATGSQVLAMFVATTILRFQKERLELKILRRRGRRSVSKGLN